MRKWQIDISIGGPCAISRPPRRDRRDIGRAVVSRDLEQRHAVEARPSRQPSRARPTAAGPSWRDRPAQPSRRGPRARPPRRDLGAGLRRLIESGSVSGARRGSSILNSRELRWSVGCAILPAISSGGNMRSSFIVVVAVFAACVAARLVHEATRLGAARAKPSRRPPPQPPVAETAGPPEAKRPFQ